MLQGVLGEAQPLPKNMLASPARAVVVAAAMIIMYMIKLLSTLKKGLLLSLLLDVNDVHSTKHRRLHCTHTSMTCSFLTMHFYSAERRLFIEISKHIPSRMAL